MPIEKRREKRAIILAGMERIPEIILGRACDAAAGAIWGPVLHRAVVILFALGGPKKIIRLGVI
jgi:hypothetical protein